MSFRTQDASGAAQHFHVRVPVTYKLPSFSPDWDDYTHDTSKHNETEVISDEAGKLSVKVYSEAQLQLLWQAFFIKTLEDDQESSYTSLDGVQYKILANTFNTVLYTYPRMDYIPKDYVPDLANLSGYWVTKDNRDIELRALALVHPQGSYGADNQLLSDLPVDPQFVRYAAQAYGIKGSALDGINDFSDIRAYLIKNKKYAEDGPRFDNVCFPPATIVSPVWYQMPLSAYTKGRSPLSVLVPLCEKLRISDLHFKVKNGSTSSFGFQIKMGIFKSATIPVAPSMNNVANTGAYNVQILASPGDKFDLYTKNGKEISCAPTTAEYTLYPAVESWGYNLVVKAEIEWKNFFQTGHTSTINNCCLIAWYGDIQYDIDCMCLVPFLTQASFTKTLSEIYLEQLIAAEGNGGDQPTPTIYANAVPSIAYRYHGSNKLVNKVAQVKTTKKVSSMHKVKGLKAEETLIPLYQSADMETLSVLSNESSYPMDQAESFEALKTNGGEGQSPYVLEQHCEASGIQPVSEVPDVKDVTISAPICPQGGNCYRRGVCVRQQTQSVKAVASEYDINTNKIEPGSKFGASICLDEIHCTSPIQVNKTNLDSLDSQLSTKGETEIRTAQLTACDPVPKGNDFQSQGDPIVEDGNSIFGTIASYAGMALKKLFSGPTLVNAIARGRGESKCPKTVQNLSSVKINSQNAMKDVCFLTSDLSVPDEVKGFKAPVKNTLDKWPQSMQEVITNAHPKFLNIPYVLQVNDDEDTSAYTPGQVAISKSEITNLNASLGITGVSAGTLPEGFRDDQSETDHFSCQTTNRCFVIVSSEQFGTAGFARTAVICNSPNAFIVAPAPVTISQPSAANKSPTGSGIYGTCNEYTFFNNAMITAVNDLSGTLQFLLPTQIPVLEGEEVTMVPLKSYLASGKRLYTCVYNMVEIAVDVTLGSSINSMQTQKLALMLWNYERPEETNIPVKVIQTPYISTWSNGKVFNLQGSNGNLPLLCRYFYMLADKSNVAQTSTNADSTIPANKGAKKVAKPKTGDRSMYEVQKILEEKLPIGLKAQVLGYIPK